MRNNKKTDAPTPDSIEAYIAQFPVDVQKILQKIRTIVQLAAPGATEAIKYQIPTFVLDGNLVHFAAYAKHIGFYPTASGIENFKNELSSYKSARGSVQFPLDQAIPFSLIKKIVKFRVKETNNKARNSASKKSKG